MQLRLFSLTVAGLLSGALVDDHKVTILPAALGCRETNPVH